MLKISKKVLDRFTNTIKKYQTVANMHKTQDVPEATTVTLVKDIMADVFGFDKYAELTSELQIRGTYCDLAVKIEGKFRYLIEVKSAGSTLNDSHIKQALDYGAKSGIYWIVLTNSIEWRLYKIIPGQHYSYEEITTLQFLNVSSKSEDDIQKLFLFCREGISSDAMEQFHQHTQMLNRFVIAQLTTSEPVLQLLRRELKRIFPELKVDVEHISDILINDVLKRDVIEGEKVKETQAMIKKAAAKIARQSAKKVAETPAT